MERNMDQCLDACTKRSDCKSVQHRKVNNVDTCWLKNHVCTPTQLTHKKKNGFAQYTKKSCDVENDVISCASDTKLEPNSQTCIPRCPDVQTKWSGTICEPRCVNPDTQWSTTKAECILRCPEEKTKWNQEKKTCVDRCASHKQWIVSSKKCKDRCSAENQWVDAKKECVARCPAEKKWETNKCVDRCTDAAKQWSVVETKCVTRCPDVNTKWDKTQGKCIDRCEKHREWDNEAKKCTDRCADSDKWNDATKKCAARCPAADKEWKGNKCVDRCTDQATKWSSEKKECVPRCTDAKTTWDQKQTKCVDRCGSAERWDDETKHCVSRCDSAADKWDEATKQCVPRCPASQEWKTDTCVDRCGTNEKWHEPSKKCYRKGPYPKTTGGNAEGARCAIPFLYGGYWQEDCVQGDAKKWCGTKETYTAEEGLKWGYCAVTCRTKAGLNKNPGEAWTEGTEKLFCKTDGELGKIPSEQTTKSGKKCVFPFKYEGKYYGECTGSNPWCATVAVLDATSSNDWGRCLPTCETQDHKQVNAGATWFNEGIEYCCGLDKKARKNVKSHTGNCLFPFTYADTKYETCIEADSPGKPWCYIDEAQTAFGYC
ncbi:balbiani ring protein 3-like [Lineus longissimus]|uniref:balbiani ring protein 3-like n=1 Tax=Lineus longissimus TaxID=88925 RepID=UPI002B4ED916